MLETKQQLEFTLENGCENISQDQDYKNNIK